MHVQQAIVSLVVGGDVLQLRLLLTYFACCYKVLVARRAITPVGPAAGDECDLSNTETHANIGWHACTTGNGRVSCGRLELGIAICNIVVHHGRDRSELLVTHKVIWVLYKNFSLYLLEGHDFLNYKDRLHVSVLYSHQHVPVAQEVNHYHLFVPR